MLVVVLTKLMCYSASDKRIGQQCSKWSYIKRTMKMKKKKNTYNHSLRPVDSQMNRPIINNSPKTIRSAWDKVNEKKNA